MFAIITSEYADSGFTDTSKIVYRSKSNECCDILTAPVCVIRFNVNCSSSHLQINTSGVMSEIRKRKEGGEEKPVESAESDHVSKLFIISFVAVANNWIIAFMFIDCFIVHN